MAKRTWYTWRMTLVGLAMFTSGCENEEPAQAPVAAAAACDTSDSDPAVTIKALDSEAESASCPPKVTTTKQPDNEEDAGEGDVDLPSDDEDLVVEEEVLPPVPVPPLPLASFDAVAANQLGGVTYTVAFPANTENYETLVISAKMGAVAPADCEDGFPVLYITGVFTGSFSFTLASSLPGTQMSFLACVEGVGDFVVPSGTAENISISNTHRVFTSSESFTGNMLADYGGSYFVNGLDGADFRCQKLADDAQLDGTFRAYLSTPGHPVADRLHFFGNLVNLQATPATVATGRTDLFDGTLSAPIKYDENGDPVDNAYIWGGTEVTGASGSNYCNYWSSPGGASGRGGDLEALNQDWINVNSFNCNMSHHLLCVEQIPTAVFEVPYFDVVATATPNEYEIQLLLPSNPELYDHLEIHADNGLSGVGPGCSDAGDMIRSENAFVPLDYITFNYNQTPGLSYSYRVCVWDSFGNLLADQLKVIYGDSAHDMFLSSIFFTGNMTAAFGSHTNAYASGVAGADDRCQQLAEAAGFTDSVWRAILSQSGGGTNNASSRLTFGGAIHAVSGAKVADNSADLWDGTIDLAGGVQVQESGAALSSFSVVWTGSTNAGEYTAGNSCTDWTLDAGFGDGGYSDNFGGNTWINTAAGNCGSTYPLYCVSQ
jgi:hypothetical protein